MLLLHQYTVRLPSRRLVVPPTCGDSAAGDVVSTNGPQHDAANGRATATSHHRVTSSSRSPVGRRRLS
jgi:hypothetical protein